MAKWLAGVHPSAHFPVSRIIASGPGFPSVRARDRGQRASFGRTLSTIILSGDSGGRRGGIGGRRVPRARSPSRNLLWPRTVRLRHAGSREAEVDRNAGCPGQRNRPGHTRRRGRAELRGSLPRRARQSDERGPAGGETGKSSPVPGGALERGGLATARAAQEGPPTRALPPKGGVGTGCRRAAASPHGPRRGGARDGLLWHGRCVWIREGQVRSFHARRGAAIAAAGAEGRGVHADCGERLFLSRAGVASH